MAGNIKGITIEFRGDTTKLDKALRQVNNETKKIDSELKKVNNALKFNPSSVDLWRQKQTLLTEKIRETEDKLKLLKQQQASMDAAGVDKNSEEYRQLQREIIETESKLKHFKAELVKVGQVDLRAVGERFKEIGQKAAEAGKQITEKVTAPIAALYAASAKAAIDYGDAIAKVSTIADESQVSIDDLKQGIIELSNETGKGSTELAEATYQALSASVETADALDFVSDATGLAKAGFLDTADAVDVLTTIINAYGYEASGAEKISSQLIQTQNDGKTTVNELASAMGTVIPTASALNIPLEQLNASYVLMTKQGINTANATTYLNGMFTELADGGSTVSEILQSKTGKTFGQLMKDGYTLGDVMQILNESVDGDSEAFLNLWGNTRAGRGALSLLNGGVEEFNEETAKMEGATGNVETALEKLATPGAAVRKALNEIVNAGIQIGDVLAPYIEKAAIFVQGLVDKFNQLSPKTREVIVTIGAIVAAIGPALLVGGKLISGVGTLIIGVSKVISFVQMLIPIFTTIASVVGVAGAAFLGIAAVIGVAAVLIYKHWDEIKAWATQLAANITAEWTRIKTNAINQVNAMKAGLTAAWNAIKSTASNVWNSIKSAIVTPITSAWEKVKAAVDKIKGLFPLSIGKIFSNLKLPHFNINGGKSPYGIGGKGTAPSISVSWYDKGGIFDSPTIIGVGEKRPEFVGALDDLRKIVREESGGGGGIVINVYGSRNMSVDELARAVEKRLISAQNRRRLAWQ